MARKRKQHHEEHIDETWLIPYADLLTLLLALFIVLFAFSQVDTQKFQSMMVAMQSAFNNGEDIIELETKSDISITENQSIPVTKQVIPKENNQFQQETVELEQLKKQLDAYIKDNNLNLELRTELDNEMLMIVISDNTLFDSGSATIKPKAQETVISISDMLVQYPKYEVVVAGHTDNVPVRTSQFESNWDLSTERALNFMKILLLNDSLEPSRFSTVGYSEYRPIATNETREGRSKNRRVEIAIKRNVTN
jgi:chemotaxis protein MotB